MVTFAASATDRVDPSPTITYSVASGSTFPEGTTTVTVTAKDGSGNSATGSFHVTYDADQTTCPFAGTYTTSWIEWDYVTYDPLVYFEWSFTIAPDGTITGEGVQTALSLVEVDDEGYPMWSLGYTPMPAGLSLTIPADGHVTDAGLLQLDYVFQEWVYLYQYDYYGIYSEYPVTRSGQVSLDAEGNMVFDDGEVWYRN